MNALWIPIASVLTAAILIHHPIEGDEEKLPSAAVLLDTHVDATGGKEARLKVKSRRMTGKIAIDIAGHKLDAKVERRSQAPGSSHLLVDGSFLHQVRVCNGKDAWEWSVSHGHDSGEHRHDSGETRLFEGGEKTRAIEQARFYAAVHWRDVYKEVRTVGMEDVEGQPAYEVKLTSKSGDKSTRFYDKKTGRLVKTLKTVDSPHMGKLEMEIYHEDYREIDGIWLPMKVREVLNSEDFGKGTQIWTYTKIEHDVKLPSSLFEMPDELQDRHKGN